MKAVLRTEKLTRRFGDLVAVNAIAIEVGEGEVFGFLGPNGAGKTTTLRLLCARIAPTSGTAEVAGYRLGRDDPKIRFFFQAEDGIRDLTVTGVQTCALPI